MPGFRRARLRGSDELFRPTQLSSTELSSTEAGPSAPTAPIDAGPSGEAELLAVEVAVTGTIEAPGTRAPGSSAPVPGAPSPRASASLIGNAIQPLPQSPAMQPSGVHPEGSSVRLTTGELTLLADALQRLKFPQHRAAPRPSLVDFERLEQLRQKLLNSR